MVTLIQRWKDPHGISIQQLMQDISDDAEIEINIQPSRPHCACCLFDLEEFRDNIENIKGVSSVKTIVNGIPNVDRWTRALSNS